MTLHSGPRRASSVVLDQPYKWLRWATLFPARTPRRCLKLLRLLRRQPRHLDHPAAPRRPSLRPVLRRVYRLRLCRLPLLWILTLPQHRRLIPSLSAPPSRKCLLDTTPVTAQLRRTRMLRSGWLRPRQPRPLRSDRPPRRRSTRRSRHPSILPSEPRRGRRRGTPTAPLSPLRRLLRHLCLPSRPSIQQAPGPLSRLRDHRLPFLLRHHRRLMSSYLLLEDLLGEQHARPSTTVLHLRYRHRRRRMLLSLLARPPRERRPREPLRRLHLPFDRALPSADRSE